MRIGIDARLLTYRRGMGTFVFQLLKELAGLPADHEYLLYADSAEASDYAPKDERFHVRLLRPHFYPAWEQVSLPNAASNDHVDILHCLANTGPLRLADGIKLVLTIHDVMYLMPSTQLPLSLSWYQRLGRVYRSWVVPRVARKAAAITTDSTQSQRDIATYIDQVTAPTIVIPAAPNPICRQLPIDSLALTRNTFSLSENMILALGGVDPRKNTGRVLEAFALVQSSLQVPYQLTVVGLPPAGQLHFREQARARGIEQHVTILGFVTEEELAALYNLAQIFVYPSLYEGFGLPVLEAMMCGTPVIAAPTGSIPEVAGNAALFVDPNSPEAIASAITRVLSDGKLRTQLIQDGLIQAERYSWRNTAHQVLDVYRMMQN